MVVIIVEEIIVQIVVKEMGTETVMAMATVTVVMVMVMVEMVVATVVAMVVATVANFKNGGGGQWWRRWRIMQAKRIPKDSKREKV